MNNDNGIFDSDQAEDPGGEFLKPFEAAMIGYLVGSRLDQSKFGVWFNKSRVVHQIYWLIGRALILLVIFLVVYFFYLLISGWS